MYHWPSPPRPGRTRDRCGPPPRSSAGCARTLRGEAIPVELTAKVGAVRLEILRVPPLDRGPLGPEEVDVEPFDDGEGDLVLDGEDVLGAPVVTLRPEVVAGRHVDELGGDAQLVAGFPDAALEDGADVQALADLPDVLGLALEGEGGGPSDDPQRLDVGQRVEDLLGHPVAEVLLLGVGGEVREGQDGDGGAVVPDRRSRAGRPGSVVGVLTEGGEGEGKVLGGGEPVLGCFSRQRLTRRAKAGGTPSGSGCGSSLRIAAATSVAVAPSKARRPASIS